jgi:hypothetical protein
MDNEHGIANIDASLVLFDIASLTINAASKQESPMNRFARSIESPDSMLESPDDHLCTRAPSNEARQARIFSEEQELSEVLRAGRCHLVHI